MREVKLQGSLSTNPNATLSAMADTKKYWKAIVTAKGLDQHMQSVGQAKVNAELIRDMFSTISPKQNSLLYVPGCGTGQMFDYLSPSDLGTFTYLFSDYNPTFLQALVERLPKDTQYEAIEDDIEESKIIRPVNSALIVLLLQHVAWKKSLHNVLRCKPDNLFFIIQAQTLSDTQINQAKQRERSITEFAKVAVTELVPKEQLEAFLLESQYEKMYEKTQDVPDTKQMIALVFRKHN